MTNHRVVDFEHEFPDSGTCLEWLKNQLYPDGIKCPKCNRVSKHHKVSKRPCYACDNCGHHTHPTAGTIFNKSTTPLKTWFAIIHKMYNTKNGISAKDIQQEYGLSYKTSRRILRKIRNYLDRNPVNFLEAITDKVPRRHNLLELTDSGTQKTQHKKPTLRHKSEEYHSESYRKRDRTARLLRLQMLLAQFPFGLKIEEIASKCSISKRTVYRDLTALESEIGIPIWEQGSKRGLVEDFFLSPIKFTTEEAMNVFLAVRLMQHYSYIYNPSVISTFDKLERIIPEPLKNWVHDTLEHLKNQPRDEIKINNFNKLTRAWLSKHRTRMHYRDPIAKETAEYLIDIYYIEPSILGHSSYMIAYCHSTQSIHDYKLDYIIGNVSIEDDTYEIPSDFKIKDYFSSAWDFHITEPLLVKLRFSKNIRKAIIDTKWHPTQRIESMTNPIL